MKNANQNFNNVQGALLNRLQTNYLLGTLEQIQEMHKGNNYSDMLTDILCNFTIDHANDYPAYDLLRFQYLLQELFSILGNSESIVNDLQNHLKVTELLTIKEK